MKHFHIGVVAIVLAILLASCQTTNKGITTEAIQQTPIRTKRVDVHNTYIAAQAIVPQAIELEAGNLFDNGGFEAGLTGWEACAAGAIQLSTTDTNTGTNALKVNANNCFYRSVRVEAGQDLILSCYAKLTSGNAWTGMGMTFSNSEWVEVAQSPVALITGRGYKRHDVRATVPFNGYYASMWFYSENPALVDDCSLMLETEPPPPPPPSGENLLENASFESYSTTNALNEWTNDCGGNFDSVEAGRTAKGLRLSNGICIDQSLDAGDIASLQGQNYSYSCYTKNSSGGYASLSAFFDNQSFSKVIPASTEFVLTELTGIAPSPASSGFVSVYSESDIVIDDCELKATSDIDVVIFPDAVLAREIRRTLGLGANDAITKEKLLELTEFSFSASSRLSSDFIKQLKGISEAKNLTKLSLQGNRVQDLDSLSGLNNLLELDLTANDLLTLDRLPSLAKLERLILTANPIETIETLPALPKLTFLQIVSMQELKDISGLASLTSLESLLGYSNSSLVDISPLADLTNLKSISFTFSRIDDLSALETLVNIEEIRLRASDITDISALVNNSGIGQSDIVDLSSNNLDVTAGSDDLQNIQKLIDRGVQVSFGDQGSSFIVDGVLESSIRSALGLSTQDTLTKEKLLELRTINLYTSTLPIGSLRGLEFATNLEELGVSLRNIYDISPLGSLQNLRSLRMGGSSSVEDYSPLANLTNLTYIDLGGTGISNIDFLSNLTELTGLDLFNNNITSTQSILPLTKLEFLLLNGNNIEDISGLRNLNNLEILLLYDNIISDISSLQNLSKLRQVSLSSNNISDITPLINNVGIGSEDRVGIGCIDGSRANTVDIQSIENLRARGVNVQYSTGCN